MRLSVGASGAIFGLDGVLISVLYFGKLGLDKDLVRRALSWVVKIALLNLLYGLRGNVDNMAHLGGLCTGLLAGVFLARTFSSQEQERLSQQTRVLAATALVLLLIVIPVKRAKAYAIELQEGEIALEHEDYKAAITHLEKYLSARPDDANGHAALGSAFQSSLRFDDAVREYQRSLALEPDTGWVELNLANIYSYRQKPAEAVALYKKCIAKAKGGATDHRWYGAALYDLKDYAGAQDQVRVSIAINEKDPAAHELMADIYDKLGKTKEAKGERRLAAELTKSADSTD